MRPLLHLHFPRLTPYATAARLQEHLVARFLAAKRDASLPAPPPYVITAEFNPVYTCGRREIGTVAPEQQAFLRCNGKSEFVEAMRGGQTTFHGPGQLVAYPIVDLRTHRLSPRCYVDKLEKALIGTCKRYGITAMTTENTGVWTSPDEKIAAVGVHMRRNITSHGIGLNVNTDLGWFERIVACGLEGKRTVSFQSLGVEGKSVGEVGEVFVKELVERLDGVEEVERRDADDFMKEAMASGSI